MPRLVGTGLLALDLIVRYEADRRRLLASGGGTCGNVLAVLARLGWEASWLGAMASSAPGRMLLDEMHRGGVQTFTSPDDAPAPIFAHHVRTCPEGHANHWFSGECPVCARNLPGYSRPSDTWLRSQARRVRSADVFFADRLSEGVLELAELARENGALVVYEPSSASDAPWMADMIAIADVVKFSSDRASALHEVARPNDRVLWVETRGSEGVRWSLGCVGAHQEVVPAVRNSRAIDACGAGDWFTSALLFGLVQTQRKPLDLVFAQVATLMQKATGLAAWSCSFLGARGGLYDAPVQEVLVQVGAAPSRADALTSLPRPVPRPDAGDNCAYQ